MFQVTKFSGHEILKSITSDHMLKLVHHSRRLRHDLYDAEVAGTHLTELVVTIDSDESESESESDGKSDHVSELIY